MPSGGFSPGGLKNGLKTLIFTGFPPFPPWFSPFYSLQSPFPPDFLSHIKAVPSTKRAKTALFCTCFAANCMVPGDFSLDSKAAQAIG
jgi:hypothetical protein